MSKIVKLGNTGELVYQLQSKLAQLKYNVKPDGSFGANTDKALKEFQNSKGLVADGIAGPNTFRALGLEVGTKAQLAASFALRNARSKSVGLCARYVANALEAAWYKVKRQPSAYLYNEKVMADLGYSRMSNSTIPRNGDIMVIDRTDKRKHGHIQIYCDGKWVSDFVQRTASPYPEKIDTYFYRDLSEQ